jgi:hypothetical protein
MFFLETLSLCLGSTPMKAQNCEILALNQLVLHLLGEQCFHFYLSKHHFLLPVSQERDEVRDKG